jgi:iron complex outermembrane receptor protein
MSSKSTRRALLAATSAIVTVLGMSQPTFAQEADVEAEGGQGDEIIVTAQKVEQNILEVPMSITAVSGQDLISTGATDILSVQRNAPGIIISNSGNDPQIIIRGAGVAGTNDIAVPVFIDGSYHPRNGQPTHRPSRA